jgi:hypothetical protein
MAAHSRKAKVSSKKSSAATSHSRAGAAKAVRAAVRVVSRAAARSGPTTRGPVKFTPKHAARPSAHKAAKPAVAKRSAAKAAAPKGRFVPSHSPAHQKTAPAKQAVSKGKADASAALAEFGYSGMQGENMVVVENTPTLHNLVVCTLCSCYPWPVLGLPPVWYKSAPYRSRAVIDPRGVMREFGLELAENVEVRVWDSTAELRYLVLPERPAGSEHLSEEALAALVTREVRLAGADFVVDNADGEAAFG